MKTVSLFKMLALVGIISFSLFSCKPKITDVQVKSAVEAVVGSGVSVEVIDGAVTLVGTVASDADKTAAEETVRALDAKKTGIKSITNNITVEAPPAPVTSPADELLASKVLESIKDFQGIKAEVKDGVITVTGELQKSRVQALKMILDNLDPKKTDMSGITVK